MFAFNVAAIFLRPSLHTVESGYQAHTRYLVHTAY